MLSGEDRFLSTDDVILAVFDDFKTIENKKKEVSAQVADNLRHLADISEIQNRKKSGSKTEYWASPGVSDYEFN
ncbi:MAG: hypothetical protein R2850_00745 [Bacteroidia bacterium]